MLIDAETDLLKVVLYLDYVPTLSSWKRGKRRIRLSQTLWHKYSTKKKESIENQKERNKEVGTADGNEKMADNVNIGT